jgi:hypothetical protein
VAAIDVYRSLRSMQRDIVLLVTSNNPQEVLAQRSCPACFGVSDPGDADKSIQPIDNKQVFICLDGNFQHRHHERASKNYIGVEDQPLFVRPEEVETSVEEIRAGETVKRVSKKAASIPTSFENFVSLPQASITNVYNYLFVKKKDRCTEQHKAEDDCRNASSWKGCNDTGLFGCCCRHDSVIYFSNIHKTGEQRSLPMTIIKRIFSEINPDIKVGVLYDIGCTLQKFFNARSLLQHLLPRMNFATAVFHSYVHDWPCQLQFNPWYNVGWGLTDGKGLERLWSYLSSLVSPLRYATQNHRIIAINHQGLFHNGLGIENLGLSMANTLRSSAISLKFIPALF